MPDRASMELKTLVYNVALYNNEAAYKKMFGLLFNSLFSFSYSMVKSREQAEEVASDVMFTLWHKRKEIIEIDNVKVYAFVIARNLSLNILKKNSNSRVIALDEINVETEQQNLNPEELLITAQNKSRLESCINALPTRCKLVFKLIKEEGLSYKEVAEILSISTKTVDAHLVTAMKKLSEALRTSHYCI